MVAPLVLLHQDDLDWALNPHFVSQLSLSTDGPASSAILVPVYFITHMFQLYRLGYLPPGFSKSNMKATVAVLHSCLKSFESLFGAKKRHPVSQEIKAMFI